MKINDQHYIVGIDLGTTNSAVAYVDLSADDHSRQTKTFPIPQLTGPGEINRLSVLPSFLYIPGEYDIAKSAVVMPWQRPADHFAGTLARDQGATVPARLVVVCCWGHVGGAGDTPGIAGPGATTSGELPGYAGGGTYGESGCCAWSGPPIAASDASTIGKQSLRRWAMLQASLLREMPFETPRSPFPPHVSAGLHPIHRQER